MIEGWEITPNNSCHSQRHEKIITSWLPVVFPQQLMISKAIYRISRIVYSSSLPPLFSSFFISCTFKLELNLHPLISSQQFSTWPNLSAIPRSPGNQPLQNRDISKRCKPNSIVMCHSWASWNWIGPYIIAMMDCKQCWHPTKLMCNFRRAPQVFVHLSEHQEEKAQELFQVTNNDRMMMRRSKNQRTPTIVRIKTYLNTGSCCVAQQL